ncbi:MAG: sugar kinase [Rhodobacterales bacterium]|nr:sugar kinase [Rhodobacterales bacterium]
MIGSVGELLVEFVCTARDTHHAAPAPYVGPFASGAPGIFIDQAARIAGQAVFAGAVGDDAFGRVILDRFKAVGVDNRLINVVTGEPTGTAHVAYNTDGSREFVFNIALSAAGHLPEVEGAAIGFLAAGIRVLHISGSTLGDAAMRDTAFALCERLHAAGVAISIDPNIRAELMRDGGYLDTVRRIVAMAEYVLPSDADAELLWPGQAFDDWASALIREGARAVVLKRGDQGCIGQVGDEMLALPAHAVQVVDPTGAGDCFCATFVALHSRDHDLTFALTHANAAGALAVSALGPMEGNSTLAQIEAFLTSVTPS